MLTSGNFSTLIDTPRTVGGAMILLTLIVQFNACWSSSRSSTYHWRATTGMVRSLIELMQRDLVVPSDTHVLPTPTRTERSHPRRPSRGRLHVVVDLTGLKVFGEWKVRKHGYSKR